MKSGFEPVGVGRGGRREEEEDRCGLGGCTPRFMQRFADPKYYLVVFCALGILQGAFFTYFIGVITTLEKRFAFESKVTGVIMIADNLSPIFTSILIGYFAGKVHKPRLIAGSMLLVVFACFLSALPYFIYGPGELDSRAPNATAGRDEGAELCDEDGQGDKCSREEEAARGSVHPAVYILFVANFINGFGYTAFYTVGSPYLDDNIKKKNTPLYFSAMSALRIFGPTLGFLLSSFCLKYYEMPSHDPGIDQQSPQWIGAWWMGFFVLGVALLFFSALIALFPRELPERFRSEKKKEKSSSEEEKGTTNFRDFPRAVRRILKNPLLVCHVISITFQVNGFAGYFVFMPKFMESQYRTTASEASLFSGATGIVSMLLGIVLGGFMIKKFKPRPRYLTGYMVFVSLFSIAGLIISVFLGCPRIDMPGTRILKDDTTLGLYNECNAPCGCTRRKFDPVCGPDGISTFFSPCFAGCPDLTLSPTGFPTGRPLANVTMFEECACVLNSSMIISNSSSSSVSDDYWTDDVTGGFCPTGSFCRQMFLAYVVMLCVSKFISSTGRVGDTLITLRCVDAQDKSFAFGIIGSVLSAFAFIPYPLIYGALTDSTCLVWEEECGKRGNCWIYDADKFRLYLHGMSALLIGIGTCFEVVVFVLSDRMTNIYGEEEEEGEKKGDDGRGRHRRLDVMTDDDDDVIFSIGKEKHVEMDPIF